MRIYKTIVKEYLKSLLISLFVDSIYLITYPKEIVIVVILQDDAITFFKDQVEIEESLRKKLKKNLIFSYFPASVIDKSEFIYPDARNIYNTYANIRGAL